MPEDEPVLVWRKKRIEELNEKYGGVKGDMFFSLSSSTPMESSGADLDGLRAQARETCGVKMLVAWRLKGTLLMHHWGYWGFIESEVCDHP